MSSNVPRGRIASKLAKPKCYRIQQIPQTTTKDELCNLLTSYVSTPVDELSITLAPSRRWLVATLMLPETLEGFKYPVDDNFIGITPLNGSDDSKIDIVAVPGLGSHAIGGFKVKDGTTNWIRDFLSEELLDARLLIYGYDSSMAEKNSKYSIYDLAKTFLESLLAFREDTNTSQKPIVFIGHSLGGLLIKEALAISYTAINAERYRDFFKSSYGLIFFGVPNLGIRHGSLRQIVVGQLNEQLIHDLEVDKEGEPTPFLQELKRKFLQCCKAQDHLPFRIVSYYEQKKTPTVQRMDDGTIKVCGEPALMVTQESACRIGLEDNGMDKHAINADHSNLVKFPNPVDQNYLMVLNQLKAMVREAPAIVRQRFARQGYSVQPPNRQSYYRLPFRQNKKFAGREKILKELEKTFFLRNEYQRIAISGLGGVGKTQVALQFAYWTKENMPEYSVFWVPALSNSSFEQAYLDISKELSLSRDNNAEDQKKLVQRYLSETLTKWILILDNADDIKLTLGDSEAPGFVDYLPESDHGLILLTTRTLDVATSFPDTDIIQLEEMTPDEAKLFLQKSLSKKSIRQEDEEHKTSLLKELNHLPLAINQAAAYLNRNPHLSIKRYLELISGAQENKIQVMSREFYDATRYRESPNAIMSTWLVSFDQIRHLDSHAADLLAFMSCIEPRSIPRSILPLKLTEHELENAIGTLCGYAFLSQRDDDDTLDMHRLVHLATVGWLEGQRQLDQTISNTLEHLSVLFSETYSHNFGIPKEYLSHGLRVMQVGRNHVQTHLVSISRDLGDTFFYLRRFKEAIRCFEQISEWESGITEPLIDSLDLSSWLASSYLEDRRMEDAINIYEHVVQIRRQTLPEEDQYRLTSEHELARAYIDSGQHIEEALQMLEHIVEIRRQTLSEEDHNRLTSEHMLAGVYIDSGRTKEALQLLERIVEIRKQILPEDDHYRLTSEHELARVYSNSGCTKEALQLLERIVEIRKQTLSEEDHYRLTSEHELARIYIDSGRTKEAHQLLEHIVQIRKQTLPEEDYYRLTSEHELARIYIDSGRTKEAHQLLERIVKIRQQTLPEEDYYRLKSEHELARVYLYSGRIEEAIALLEHVVLIGSRLQRHDGEMKISGELLQLAKNKKQIL